MSKRLRLLGLSTALSLLVLAQSPEAVVQVTGAVKQPLSLTAEALGQLPRATVKTSSNGLETVYEGVWVHELLRRAGAPQGTALRGKALASYVVARATDGYQVVFSLAELDPTFLDNRVLLADTANGKPLFGAQGRFRLVAPQDGPGARSVRMLAMLEVVQLRQ